MNVGDPFSKDEVSICNVILKMHYCTSSILTCKTLSDFSRKV